MKDARDRLQKQMEGYELSIRDVANMVWPPHLIRVVTDDQMEICPYEVSYLLQSLEKNC